MISPEQIIKNEQVKAKVEKMKAWFAGRKLPERIQISPYLVIFSLENYVQTAFQTLEHTPFLSLHFKAAYMRLFRIKQLIEKNEQHFNPQAQATGHSGESQNEGPAKD